MCNMRIVIIDNKKEVLRDYVATLSSLDINIIDRPALCVYTQKNENGFCSLLFKYSNIKEDTLDINSKNGDTFLVIGSISGCLYSVVFKAPLLNHKSFVDLCKFFSDKYKMRPRRFHDNLVQFSKLTVSILKEIEKIK